MRTGANRAKRSHAGIDVGLVSDPSVVCIAHRDGSRSEEGAGCVAAVNLSRERTRVTANPSADDCAAGYAAERARRRRGLMPGGGPFDAEVSPYGSGRRRGLWDDF